MHANFSLDQISLIIKRDLLLDQLGVGGSGTTAADLADDMPLIEGGLDLDSVDALDLLVSVEKTFGFKIPALDKAFIDATCATIGTLAAYVHGRVAQAGLASAA